MIDAEELRRQDERRDPRYEGRLEAVLRVAGGGWWRCWIRDISIGGAGLEPAMPALVGHEVELRSPGFDFDGGLPGRVINVAHRRTCMVFDLDATTRQQLIDFLSANVASD
jgi:hypothetical protein